jgi:hypothetical protein
MGIKFSGEHGNHIIRGTWELKRRWKLVVFYEKKRELFLNICYLYYVPMFLLLCERIEDRG